MAALGVTIFGAYTHLLIRSVRLEFKTNLIWDFMMRKALSEGLQKGLMTQNSPIELAPRVRPYYAGMAAELKAFYRKHQHLDEREMFRLFEHHFGERMVKEVCVPLGLVAGACVIMAIAIAREPE